MEFDRLVRLVSDLRWFDLATLVQLSDARRETLRTQLHRFMQSGKVIPLRRGMYVLAPTYRKAKTHPPHLANAIYAPSYLSDLWALSYHGVIPEHTVVLTSVTSRTPKRFVNDFGEFTYRHVKQTLFFGFSPIRMNDLKVFVASAEKALVDHWHLEHGEWTTDRLRAMRFDPAALNEGVLKMLIARLGKPRLVRAFENFRRVAREDEEGEVTL
ncbi:MAG: hypothetical protein KAI47_00515 [Deltaproteobacteria bacterium]|nr:hypothetical protein [Deltaproteobacteria bacterium]